MHRACFFFTSFAACYLLSLFCTPIASSTVTLPLIVGGNACFTCMQKSDRSEVEVNCLSTNLLPLRTVLCIILILKTCIPEYLLFNQLRDVCQPIFKRSYSNMYVRYYLRYVESVLELYRAAYSLYFQMSSTIDSKGLSVIDRKRSTLCKVLNPDSPSRKSNVIFELFFE